MRILHLLDQASPEANPGTLRVLDTTCSLLTEHEHHVMLMGGSPLAQYAKAASLRQGRVVGVPRGRAPHGVITLAPHIAALQPIDLIHAWSPASAAAACARYARIPTLLTVSQPLSHDERHQVEQARVMNPSLHLIVTHRTTAMELAQVHWPSDSITLTVLPVQRATAYQRTTQDLLHMRWGGCTASTKVGLLLCDYLPGPNAADAVLAVAMAEHILDPAGITLKVLVHPDQAGRQRADRAASQLGHSHRLVCEPATLAPWLLTDGCDFALAVGQGNNVHSIAHAMAAGVPIIAEHQPALGHLLEHEVTALLVPPSDPHAMGHAIQSMLRNPTMARSLRESARQRVEAECSAAAYQEAVAEGYALCAAAGAKRQRVR